MEYRINIKTLTPVHTGSGNELSMNFDLMHFPHEECLAVVNAEKVFELLREENIDEWVKQIERKVSMMDFLKKENPRLKPNDIGSRILNIVGKAPSSQTTVKEQYMSHAEKKPTLSGSSIKGAMRTAFLTQKIYGEQEFASNRRNLGLQRSGQFVFKDTQIIAHFMGNEGKSYSGEGRHSPNKDLFRFVRVSDFYFDTPTICIKQNIVNRTNYGWGLKDREASFVECIPTGASVQGRIQMPDDLMKEIKKYNYISKDVLGPLSITSIFNDIYNQTKELVIAELDFWKTEKNPSAIDDYIVYLEDIKTAIEACKDNECILRLGAGSGWQFMTGDWAAQLLEDNDWNDLKRQLRRGSYPNSMEFPKTRKLLHNGQPLGFIKMTIN